MNLVRWLRSLCLLSFILGATIPSAAQTIDDLKQGVVKITAQTKDMGKVGTGFVVRVEKDTVYVVTAAHVVEGDPKPQLTFYTRQDTQYPATVRNAEGKQAQGLAILVAKVPPDVLPSIAALALDTTTKLSGGEDMVTIGFPRTGGQWAVIKGGVTSREGRSLNLDANIHEGNSGGPIVYGSKVVGLVTGKTNYGSGVTAASVQDYLEGFNVTPRATSAREPATASSAPVVRSDVEQTRKDLASQITGKDGAPMVLVPAGEFLMGKDRNTLSGLRLGGAMEKLDDAQYPPHMVYLDTYYIDRYEVTITRYAEFFRGTNRTAPAFWSDHVLKEHGRKPIVGVDWNDAAAYCAWVRKRLPTEAEWEKAARGTDGRKYPWGNEPPNEQRGNSDRWREKFDYRVLTDVGSYEAGKSPYGTYDMVGNVEEWVADWYDENYYGKSSPRNPTGPSSGDYRALRGGSWYNGGLLEITFRSSRTPTDRSNSLGFRCAKDVPK